MGSIRLVHISDLHLEPNPETFYPGANQAVLDTWILIRQEHPDLVLISGDLTTDGGRRPESLEWARRCLDALGLPYLVIPGNHDLPFQPAPYEDSEFYRLFHQPPIVRRDLGPLTIFGLALQEDDPDGSLSALEQELDHTSRPVLLMGHYPLRPVRQSGVLATFGAEGFAADAVMRLSKLLENRPQVRLYACGHVHAVSVMPIEDTAQISAGALGPGPSAFWIYEADDSHLTYALRLGAGPLDFWSGRVPGPVLAPEYHLGNATERFGVLPF